MAGAIEYQTERGHRAVVMIDQIGHMLESGAPRRTLIYLSNGTTLLRSREGIDTLRQRINEMATGIAIEQAKACHFANLEVDPE